MWNRSCPNGPLMDVHINSDATCDPKEHTVWAGKGMPHVIPRLEKRPPTKFINSVDWSMYLRICCQLRHIKVTYECSDLEAENILHTSKSDHSSRIIRLICAFNRLYAEYSHLSDLLSRVHSVRGRVTRDSRAITGSQHAPNKHYETTVSSGCGDTKAQITDISLDHTRLRTPYTVREHHDQQAVRKERDLTGEFRESAPLLSSVHHTTGALDPKEKLTPYETSASGRTVVNSTSTSLQWTQNQEPSVSSFNVSQASLRSRTPLNRPSTGVCFRWCRRPAKYLEARTQWSRKREALRICKHLERQRMIESSKAHESESITQHEQYYDKINRPCASTSVLVYQRSCHRYRVEHVVHMSNSEVSRNGFIAENPLEHCRPELLTRDHVNPHSVHLPIALELVLPTTQCQIEKVMQCCSNICDPLEVAAELRQFNYNTDACIAYFRQIRSLRDIIHEFLPRQTTSCKSTPKQLKVSNNPLVGVECRNKSEPKLTAPYALSTHCNQLTTLHDLQIQISTLKRFQADAARRLARVRTLASDMITKLQKQIEDKLVAQLCTTSNPNRLLRGAAGGELPVSQVAKLVQENRSLKLTLRTEENRRKAVFNMMQEYLGNIRVYCRCRAIPHTSSCIDARSAVDTVILRTTPDTVSETYKFDRVFDSHATQAEVYTELAPSVCSFMDGYNVCFLTYGGEASGKTYTLLGTESNETDTQGIAQRALRNVLSEREARSHEWEYHLAVTVVEIYNDTLIDLLSGEKGINIRVESGPDRMLENLKSMEIEHETDIEQLLTFCRERRRTGRTALNDQSSRSHLIIFARLNARSRIHDTHVCSLLALSDLAGFEDIIKAETLMDPILAKEAGYINRSLTALNRVFMSLRSQDPSNVSYRDSKLTFLLKPFFTHSGKCILIVTIRMDRNNAASTQSTLRFARDSRGVHLGRARRQFNWDKLIDDMRTA